MLYTTHKHRVKYSAHHPPTPQTDHLRLTIPRYLFMHILFPITELLTHSLSASANTPLSQHTNRTTFNYSLYLILSQQILPIALTHLVTRNANEQTHYTIQLVINVLRSLSLNVLSVLDIHISYVHFDPPSTLILTT